MNFLFLSLLLFFSRKERKFYVNIIRESITCHLYAIIRSNFFNGLFCFVVYELYERSTLYAVTIFFFFKLFLSKCTLACKTLLCTILVWKKYVLISYFLLFCFAFYRGHFTQKEILKFPFAKKRLPLIARKFRLTHKINWLQNFYLLYSHLANLKKIAKLGQIW